MKEFIIASINGQLAACNSVLIDLAKAKRRWKEKKLCLGSALSPSWLSWYGVTLVALTDCRWWFDSPLGRE